VRYYTCVTLEPDDELLAHTLAQSVDKPEWAKKWLMAHSEDEWKN